MKFLFAIYIVLSGVIHSTVCVMGQAIDDYDSAYIGKPLADPIMQHNKEMFVLYGCAYCHGLYLKPVGEAADLRKSAIVGADVNANLIGPILRAGIPQTPKSSPMPQFSDLSDQEIRSITAYIHYCRANENYKTLINEPITAGNVADGKAFYQKNCASCHSIDRDLPSIVGRYDANELREQFLDPASFRKPRSSRLSDLSNAKLSEGRAKHQMLLENYKRTDVDNILAYLLTLRPGR